MKKLFVGVGVAVVLYWVLAIIIVKHPPAFLSGLEVKDRLSDAIELFAGLSTFGAVVVSLFGKTILRKCRAPILKLSIAADEDHCAFLESDMSSVDLQRKVLAVYASVCNDSETEAVNSQLVCNKAFVSADYDKFQYYRSFRAASFEWHNSSDENKYLTTLRRSVPKYAKLFEIVQTIVKTEEDGTPNSETRNGANNKMTIDISICLPQRNSPNQYYKLKHEFKSILLPVCLASETASPARFYIMLHWKGEKLDKMPTKDNLELKVLTQKEAHKVVSVNLD